MLIGCKDVFLNLEDYDVVFGYINFWESGYDFFIIGYIFIFVSLVCGFVKVRDLKGGYENIIVVIGDGLFSGGEVYEGLSNVGEMGINFIIVVNDNEMFIVENYGGFYQNLKELCDMEGWLFCNFFCFLGLDYFYVGEGNDILFLVVVFVKVKDILCFIVVYIYIQKGKGYVLVEVDWEEFYWEMFFDLEMGKLKVDCSGMEDYYSLIGKFLLEKMKEDYMVVVISLGIFIVIGFIFECWKQVGCQFVDVGIVEEYVVVLVLGIVVGGGCLVYGVYSIFIQCCYDQLFQDLCINGNLVVIIVFMGIVVGMNDVIYLGFFDILFISNILNMVYLVFMCFEEYFVMLEWVVCQMEYFVVICVLGVVVVYCKEEFDMDYSELNCYKMIVRGEIVVIFVLGFFYDLGQVLKNKFWEELGVEVILINFCYIIGFDELMLEELKVGYCIVVMLEDGVLDGGFGEKIVCYYGNFEMWVLNYGFCKEFVDCYNLDELMKVNWLIDKQMVEDIVGILE